MVGEQRPECRVEIALEFPSARHRQVLRVLRTLASKLFPSAATAASVGCGGEDGKITAHSCRGPIPCAHNTASSPAATAPAADLAVMAPASSAFRWKRMLHARRGWFGFCWS